MQQSRLFDMAQALHVRVFHQLKRQSIREIYQAVDGVVNYFSFHCH
jgi:hypothetical protein